MRQLIFPLTTIPLFNNYYCRFLILCKFINPRFNHFASNQENIKLQMLNLKLFHVVYICLNIKTEILKFARCASYVHWIYSSKKLLPVCQLSCSESSKKLYHFIFITSIGKFYDTWMYKLLKLSKKNYEVESPLLACWLTKPIWEQNFH